MQTQIKLMIIAGLLALASCRNPGLPPEAPEHDAANPEAGPGANPGTAEGEAQADPFTRSAFEGESLDGGGHEHHHHGHAKPKPAQTKAEPAPEGGAQGGRS